MDAFERAEAKRLFLQKQIIPVWVEFQAAADSLLDTYNQTQKGRSFPASLKSLHDGRLLVITAPGD